MNQQEKFNETVGILVKAYLNDTLAKGTCSACAVGNLVADGLKAKVVKTAGGFCWTNQHSTAWERVFMTGRFAHQQSQHGDNYKGLAKKQIDATGYRWQDLARIEFAFETAYVGGFYDGPEAEQGMYAGLMAVVDVLAEIHGLNLEAATEAKALFVKA